jgi:hypothetical protein
LWAAIIYVEKRRLMKMHSRRTILSRWIKALVSVAVGIVLWRSRIVQVISFVIAAGVERSHRAENGPALVSSDWHSPNLSAAQRKALNARALITYHPEYHAYDSHLALQSLALSAELGAGWMRSDVRWRELLPDGKTVNTKALAWYRNFLHYARDYGLRNMVVLSTPPDAVLAQRSQERLKAWSDFIEIVVRELGSFCNAYQLMNEPNGPIYRFFSAQDAATATRNGAAIIKRETPSCSIAVNISMEIWGWREYLEQLLRSSGAAIDIVGLDHYPGTWTIGQQNRWFEIVQLGRLIAAAAPDSPWFNRRLTIMETGFSTNRAFRGESQQLAYFDQIPAVTGALSAYSTSDAILLGVYELCDGDSSPSLNPEAHFGLLTTDLKPKAAYGQVQQLFQSL